MHTKVFFVAVAIFIVIDLHSVTAFLLWPEFTVLQVTAAFSVPVEISPRKVYFDWGFQMNYDMPFNDSSFYNIPIWPGWTKRSVDEKCYRKYDPEHQQGLEIDLTAGEFYGAIEDLLTSYGFHETCLLKSVCELAKHPFDDERDNLLVEVLNFILSPSTHQAFGTNETAYKHVYESAEDFGRLGEDCDVLYPKCSHGILNKMTMVKFN